MSGVTVTYGFCSCESQPRTYPNSKPCRRSSAVTLPPPAWTVEPAEMSLSQNVRCVSVPSLSWQIFGCEYNMMGTERRFCAPVKIRQEPFGIAACAVCS
jgi:hypothetical protein|eukprot:COSAG06_NODE_901_length_11650_cov_7.150203_3_plen_99_part_00